MTIVHGTTDAIQDRAVMRGSFGAGNAVVTLDPTGTDEAGRAMYESPVIVAPIAFNEALCSWNIDVPSDCGVRVEVRVRQLITGPGPTWTDYLYVGRAGDVAVPLERVQESDPEVPGDAQIDVDYFRNWGRCDRIQYRLTAVRAAETGDVVRVRRFGVCLSARDTSEVARGRTREAPELGVPSGPVRLDVPFRSQKTQDASIAGRICSPTSVTMVMSFRGVEEQVGDVAARAFDADFDIYGNWPRNIQAAYEYGVPGYLTRFDSWTDVEKAFEAGQPIIVSINVKRGELTNAPYRSTNGHLLVLHGFDEHGDVLVSDPAATKRVDGQTTYARDELTRVWLERCAGTAYILLPPG